MGWILIRPALRHNQNKHMHASEMICTIIIMAIRLNTIIAIGDHVAIWFIIIDDVNGVAHEFSPVSVKSLKYSLEIFCRKST